MAKNTLPLHTKILTKTAHSYHSLSDLASGPRPTLDSKRHPNSSTPLNPTSQLVPWFGVLLGVRNDLLVHGDLLPRHGAGKRPRLERHVVDKLPRDLDPAHVRVGELVEGGGAEVEVVLAVAARAGVLDGDDDAVGRFARLPDFDLVPAEGVVVRVGGVVDAHGAGGEGGDEVGVGVLAAAGAEADGGGVEGSVAFVDGRGEGGEGEEGPG